MTVELIQGLLLAFAIVVILMPPYIRLLRATGFTKQIRIEGPDSHQVKHGTPTMGGALIIIVVLALYFLFRWPPEGGIFAPLAAIAGVGLLGAFDDYLNAKTGEGIRVRQKLLWQIVVAFFAAFQIQRTYAIDQIAVPFVGKVGIDPTIFVIFAAFAIIAASNGVNITDGLDGLAGGTLVFAFVAFLLVALLNNPSQPNLIFVIETASDIIQIGYYKISGGKRIFRMAPLHHHFELAGWDEEKITLRFWIVGILAGLLGVTLFLASIKALD